MIENLILFFGVVVKILITCIIFPATIGWCLYWLGYKLRNAMDKNKIW
jgi:hypothetical protein